MNNNDDFAQLAADIMALPPAGKELLKMYVEKLKKNTVLQTLTPKQQAEVLNYAKYIRDKSSEPHATNHTQK